MKKRIISTVLSLGIAASLPITSNTSATHFSGDRDKQAEEINGYSTCTSIPEVIEYISPYMKQSINLNSSGILLNLWYNHTRSNKYYIRFIGQIYVADNARYYVDWKSSEIDEFVEYIKASVGYENYVEITSEERLDLKNEYFLSVKFSTEEHDLNRMIAEKIYALVAEKYTVSFANACINSAFLENFYLMPQEAPVDFKSHPEMLTEENIENYNKILAENGIRVQYTLEPYYTYNTPYYAVFPDDITTYELTQYISFVHENFGGVPRLGFDASGQSKNNVNLVEGESSYLAGDANCDGSLNLADAVFVMQSLANPSKYAMSAQGSFNGDIDAAGNGITGKDALAIQRQLLGISPTA